MNAQSYAMSTISYIARNSAGTPRYNTWFGPYDIVHRSIVQNHLRLINENNFTTFTYDCAGVDPPTVYAYVCAFIF